MLKRITTVIFTIFIFTASVFCQAKKPTIMVVPSDNFCQKNGYMSEYEIQGKTISYPDYQKAFQNDDQIRLVITKMGAIMADRGFPMKDLEQVLKSLNNKEAELALLSSKTTGASIYETPIDQLKRVAKADIILDLDYNIKKNGPQKYITFILKGLDSYTNKQVAGAAGSGEPSSAATSDVLLEEAVLSYMDNFNDQLMTHFEDMFEKGREVTISIMIWDDAMFDLEEEFTYDDVTDELGFLIEDWLADNTVEGRFSTTDATENQMKFEQVRIPLYFEHNGKQRAMDTRRFTNQLRSYLRKDPFLIDSKIYQKGLGEVWLILGEK